MEIIYFAENKNTEVGQILINGKISSVTPINEPFLF